MTGLLCLPILYGSVAANTRISVRSRNRGELNGGVSKADTQWVKLLYYALVPGGNTTTTAILKAAPPAALVTLTASATAWANGAWVQITAATTEAWQLAFVNVTEANLTFNTAGDDIEIDVGVGAAASEVVVTTVRIETRQSCASSTGVMMDPVLINQIGSGVRVAMRARHRRAASLTFNVALGYYGGTL